MSRAPAAVPGLLAALLLVGCQQAVVRDEGATGNLGSPLAKQSPADVYIDLSAAYLRENQLTVALQNANKAVLVDPRSSNAHYVLALVQQRLGEYQAADASYRKSIDLDSRNPVALNGYGSFLCEQRRYDDADPYFRRALGNPLYKTPWLARHNAGWCKQQASGLAAAEADYRAALQLNPRFAPSLLSMAEVSYADGSYLSARAYLQRYAEVAQHTAATLWLGVRTEKQLGDRDQMARYSRWLRTDFPDSDEAKFLREFE